MAGLRADILHALCCDAAREIPAGEKARHGGGKCFIRARPFGIKARQDGGVFNLAGQMRCGGAGLTRRDHHHTFACGQRHARHRDFARAGRGIIFNTLRAEQNAPRAWIST